MQAIPMTSSTEPAALEGLFREHGRSVFRAAYRITGSESDAEDVVQTVFLRLLAHDHVSKLHEEPGSYLKRAAANAALDVLRRRKTTRAVPIDDDDPLPDERGGPERAVGNARLGEALRRGIAELPQRAAEVFTLRYLEGLSNTEIAEALGTSTGVVAVTLHRARRALQGQMKSFLGELS